MTPVTCTLQIKNSRLYSAPNVAALGAKS